MGVNVLRCHRDAVKRLVTEDSPDLFLTVAEVLQYKVTSIVPATSTLTLNLRMELCDNTTCEYATSAAQIPVLRRWSIFLLISTP